MRNRSYNQLCGLACALDIIGERWTILLIRELMPGSRRFTDLMNGLPGISTNLLTQRLKRLEQQGVIRQRVLPPPACSTVYELTELGRSLEATLLELGKWGSQFVPDSMDQAQVLHVGSYALTPKTFFRPELAEGVDATYALYIGTEVQQIHIADGDIAVRQGEPPHADVSLYTNEQIYLGLLLGKIDPDEARSQGLIRVEGDMDALRRFLDICRISSPEPQ